MKKINNSFIIAILFITSNFQLAKATHVAGADITYENVGVDSFLVTVNIFEDCGGAATLGNTITVRFSNTCGLPETNLTFNQTSVSEVSQLCGSEQLNSTCNGGTLPGMLQKVYQRIVVLDACNSWTITWGIANRNATINLDPPGNTYFFAVDATLNSALANDNSSPLFNGQPIPYVCANQLVNYSFGVSELDGDSLVYSFADPLGGSTANPIVLNYQPGYTSQQPIPGIVIDPTTGLITFTPTVLGGFVVVIIVQEFRNGILVGFVKRDIQFVVRSCVNNLPSIFGGEITNLSGDALQTGSYTLEICEGNSFNFDVVYADQDLTDTLTIFSNIASVLPGSVITNTGTNPLTVNISWTAPIGFNTQYNTFSIVTNDGGCPIPGIQSFVYNINLNQSTFISPSNATICINDGVQLNAFGGTSFTWYDLSGNQIIAGNQFSCNNCPNPIVNPSVSSSYIVESNLSSACFNRDTVVITIAALPTAASISANGPTSFCFGNTVILTGNIDGVWSNGDTTAAIAVASSGTYDVTNTNVCASSVSNQIVVTVFPQAITPIITQVGFNLETTVGYISYQWFSNNFPIPNETNVSFTPTTSGDYYVLVMDSNGCQAQSAIYNFVGVGMFEGFESSHLIAVPNPSNNFITLQSKSNVHIEGILKVWSMSGGLMYKKSLIKGNQNKIDIEEWANGLYMIELIGNTKTERFKFIKQ
jgi:hypothetical protein